MCGTALSIYGEAFPTRDCSRSQMSPPALLGDGYITPRRTAPDDDDFSNP